MGSLNGVDSGSDTNFPNSDQFVYSSNGASYNDPYSGLNFELFDNQVVLPESVPSSSVVSSTVSTDGEVHCDDNDFSDTVLNYISQMLMEEDMEAKPCMFHDPLALQAAVRSFSGVLGEKHLPPTDDHAAHYGDQFLVDSLEDELSSYQSDYSHNSSSSNDYRNVPVWNGEFSDANPSFMQMPIPSNFVFGSTVNSSSQPWNLRNDVGGNGVPGSSVRTIVHPTSVVAPNLFNETDLALQFKKGVEEANSFLPKNNKLIIDLETNRFNTEFKEKASESVVKEEKYDGEYMHNWFRVKKNHEREEADYEEERSNKQSAVYIDESALADMFDKVLVGVGERCGSCKQMCLVDENPQNETSQQNKQANESNDTKTKAKREVNKRGTVDLRTLLILCAQSVSTDDRKTALELLKQIRQHSSPFGDGSQRLAHYFANSLDARLAGTGPQIYSALSAEKTSAADMLKAYQTYISVCPFKKIALIFANHTIRKLAQEATTLHIIDFGILYGFQWPALIYRLSKRPGGPPKLRITGIELPQSGFRPAERVQETGRRLAKYCELHNVPFEYNGLAQKWETIKIDDLKIRSGEALAVNCLFRFKNLLDETVAVSNPRNAVLNLIKKAKPDLFVHAIINGSYSVPFFVSRFREALYHYSALFDLCDANMGREDEMRLKYEKEFCGREIMNIIACEGSERVERAETYKQWQLRNRRAGLKPLPLDPLLINRMKGKVKAGYHSDFMVDQDGNWMLQGWKGRIVCASSAWVPS